MVRQKVYANVVCNSKNKTQQNKEMEKKRKKTNYPKMGNFLSDQTLSLVSTYYMPDLFLSIF